MRNYNFVIKYIDVSEFSASFMFCKKKKIAPSLMMYYSNQNSYLTLHEKKIFEPHEVRGEGSRAAGEFGGLHSNLTDTLCIRHYPLF